MAEPAYSEEDIEQDEKALLDKLDSFGSSLSSTRSEAIRARQTSGIEDIWREDEEFYEGIDDLNRGDEKSLLRNKPPYRATTAGNRTKTTRSRVFPNITAPYVDTLSAHIADLLLPTEEAPWSLEPTPVPELDELAEQYSAENPEEAEQQSSKGMMSRLKGMLRPDETAERNERMVEQPETSPEQAFQERQLAKKVAEATERRIWDWHVECQFNAEVRRVIEDSCKVGVGILKGPVPKHKEYVGWHQGGVEIDEDGVEVEVPPQIHVRKETNPSSKRIDYWNFFPHGACGQNIQNGAYTWERDYITKKQLRDLKGQDGYIDVQIDRCLKEGPKRAGTDVKESYELDIDKELKDKYEIWYFHGTAEKENLEAAGCDCEGRADPHMPAKVTMVNEHVIRAELPAVDYGGFPYDVFCVRKRANYWAGIGVARQIRVAQKIVVGGCRTLMDNAGLAGGPMIVFKPDVVQPADGIAGIGPRKVFYIAKDDATIADATKAIGTVKVDMLVGEMKAIIDLGLQFAEMTTGMPMILQGQMGRTPDRVGVVNVLDRNTNANLRRFAKNFSDDVIGPHLRRYYYWHLQYGPDNEKGDLQVNVSGYQVQVERSIQQQSIPQLINLSLDPRFGLDPKKVIKELMSSMHLNSADMEVDDDQWQQMLEQWAQMMQAAGNDPRVQVAQINAEARLQAEQMKGEYSGAQTFAKLQQEDKEHQAEMQMRMIEDAAEKELEMLKHQGVGADTLATLKSNLAREVMKIRSVYDLANMKASADMMPKPPFEPPGRAPAGESYQR